MKHLLSLAALVVLTTGGLVRSSVSATKSSTVAEQLSQIEHQLAKAWVERDRDTINNILASDWTVTDIAGRVLTKAQVLQEFDSQDRQIESGSIDDIKVRELGDVAIVTGKTTLTGQYKGNRSTLSLRFTDVFVKRDGHWQVVASQGTQIPGDRPR
jgi:ketosteroid isomerase-like protein